MKIISVYNEFIVLKSNVLYVDPVICMRRADLVITYPQSHSIINASNITIMKTMNEDDEDNNCKKHIHGHVRGLFDARRSDMSIYP